MNQPFSIFQLTESDIDLSTIDSNKNYPHNHDYEELIIGVEGDVEHFIDYKKVSLKSPFVSFVASGKMHAVQPRLVNGKCNIWALKFQSDFIPQTTFRLYSYYHDHANFQISMAVTAKHIFALLEMIVDETRHEKSNFTVIRHLLAALFAIIESEKKNIEQEKGIVTKENETFKQFLILLESHYHEHVGVKFYADKLFMSARNLNNICHNILQRSVIEIIELRKLIEAKNLLINTEKSISEIGLEVGYNENTYFTNVFKKKSGQTPSEFRAEMKRLIS